MLRKPLTFAAIAATTFFALFLTGSTRTIPQIFDPIARKVSKDGKNRFQSAQYGEALELFIRAAILGQASGDTHIAAMNWNNAGVCWSVELQFSKAAEAFRTARRIAEDSNDNSALASTMNNFANLYIHMGEADSAMQTAREALNGPARHGEAALLRPKLRLQMALALAQMHRYDEALPIYKQGTSELISQGDATMAARALSSLADESLKVNRLSEASAALKEGLSLLRDKNADSRASILDGLAKLRARQGQTAAAARLFDEALAVSSTVTPRWKLYADRAQFRLSNADLKGAFTDFREARAIALRMRLDVVPADQDRVSLESGLGEVAQGLVESGNRFARESGNAAILAETFDAAEQDRQWSLRALVPAVDDWRTRLPERYWDLLARYQLLERAAVSKGTPEAERTAAVADDELKRMEAQAGQNAGSESAESALSHVRANLSTDAVLLSFHISRGSSWVWTIDRHGTSVYPLPPYEQIERQAAAVTRTVREGTGDAAAAGRALYASLVGGIPETYLSHPKWLLELDGPLYSVPFGALVVNGSDSEPRYLLEKATLQLVPGALLLNKSKASPSGILLVVGDAIYNGADPRYRAARARPEMTLPRLPNTAAELDACSRAWGPARTRLLTGVTAGSKDVIAAIAANPDIIHFATHVVPASGDFRTGLIALSLDPNGVMGVLGPREIVARPVKASLVVLDGCHSAQAQALPGSGLMGLTRAWIGAGAGAVIATQWDIPDENSQSLMSAFYTAISKHVPGSVAGALREAQLARLKQPDGRHHPATWAGYFLESRNQ